MEDHLHFVNYYYYTSSYVDWMTSIDCGTLIRTQRCKNVKKESLYSIKWMKNK